MANLNFLATITPVFSVKWWFDAQETIPIIISVGF